MAITIITCVGGTAEKNRLKQAARCESAHSDKLKDCYSNSNRQRNETGASYLFLGENPYTLFEGVRIKTPSRRTFQNM